jgi:CDP-diacylglycerol--glycerol-3-phosphate 3-phosphatidyltransferase
MTLPVDRPGPLRPPASASDPAAVPADPGVSWRNVANGLTLLRVLLVPAVALLALEGGGHRPGWRLAAAAAFAVASVTDRFDGQVARSRGLVTPLGKLADPIADKALTGTALVVLTVLSVLPAWITAVILVREVGVTLLRFWVLRHGVIAASRGGKVKTFLQALAITCYLLPESGSVLGPARAVLMGLALVVTLVTGADYVARALALRRSTPGGAGAG